jgi:predicted RNase H-like HicB family nuclease
MKNTHDYLSLNYHKRLYQDEEGDWIVEVDDLPGCIADGRTPDEAIENLRQAMRSWIDSRIQAGLDVPEPSVAEEYSGKILVRMPRFLHRRLSLQAKTEGVSLNQYIVSLLVDASRANLASNVLVQNVASSLIGCGWENVAGGYFTNVSYREQGWLPLNNFCQSTNRPQGSYVVVNEKPQRQLTVGFPPALIVHTENA